MLDLSTVREEASLSEEFLQVNWASGEMQFRYKDILLECSRFFTALELEMVRAGYKPVTIQVMTPEEILTRGWELLHENLAMVPLAKIQQSQIYQSSAAPIDGSKPWSYRVAIGNYETVRAFIHAYHSGNYAAVGSLLGYPSCCVEFFEDTWIRNKWLDTTLPMSEGLKDHKVYSPFCNILWRWLGVRFVSHLPCSFHCEKTRSIGQTAYDLAKSLKQRTKAEMILNILSWPVEWSGLHGIGMLTTPICKASFRTDMLKEKHVVRLHGTTYPTDAPDGLDFPFSRKAALSMKKPNANGFYGLMEESRAHNAIIDVLRLSPPTAVIDLGCGDSILLEKLEQEFGCETTGVDLDAGKNPSIVSNIFDLQDFPRDYHTALIARARLVEEPQKWRNLLEIIERHCKRLVIYSYNDLDPDRNFELGSFRLFSSLVDRPYNVTVYVRETSAQAD